MAYDLNNNRITIQIFYIILWYNTFENIFCIHL